MATFYIESGTGRQLTADQLTPGQTYITSGTGQSYTAPQKATAANAPVSPAQQSTTPVVAPTASTVAPNNFGQTTYAPTGQESYTTTTQPQAQTQPSQQNQTQQYSAPSTTLSPGAQGQDVQALQSFLTETINPATGQPYLTQEQMATGTGIFGPQTTAAVKSLQGTLGVPQTGTYGPQTQGALSQKYQNLFAAKSGSTAPTNAADANSQIASANASQTSTDPVFAAMASAIGPIMASLGLVLSNVNNSTLTGVSLQQEYNDLAQQSNLPALQTQMLNMQNVMNGTESDIRDEITKSGGTVTDSQVLAMSAARNKVILKQYNAVATQYTAAQQNIQNMMQYAAQDQSTQLQRQSLTASVTESMASIESQMMQMGMTMQNHTTDNLNKIVSNVGYTGLAAQAQGNPAVLGYYENLLGLAPGALSNPTTLAQMETYRQSQLALGQQKVNISLSNAGSLQDYRAVLEQSKYSSIAQNTIRQMYQTNKNPVQIYNSSSPILSRIDAALPIALDPNNKDKGAADLDLVDAYVQIARGGQNITEAQIDYLQNSFGISAKYDVATQKITNISGSLTDSTRRSLANLSKGIVSNQKKQADLAVTQINKKLSAISGFPSDMLLQSPADIQLYTDTSGGGGGGSTFTSDSGSSYTLPY